MKTYTNHKLTNHQLMRLSQMVNGRRHHAGVALGALVRKGLAEETGVHKCGSTHRATDAGKDAFWQAREEGW